MPYITSIERAGLKRGLEQGQQMALREVAHSILESRFQEVPAVIQERLAEIVELERLQSLACLAATAESLDEFRGEMDA